MSANDFRKVIEQVKPETEEVCLHLMGEPLAHPEFEEILEICNEVNVAINITTNGVLIKRKQDLLLASTSLRQINFSLQSFKDNHPNASLEKYLDPIIHFTKELNALKPEVYVNYRLWNIGRNTINENEEIFSIVESKFEIEINRNIQVENIKSKRIWNRLYLHFDSDFEWPSTELEYQGTVGRCHGLINHIGIHADGTVVPCCLDKEAQINLGNCIDASLSGILNSHRANTIRNGFRKNELTEKLCQHCSYIGRFNK